MVGLNSKNKDSLGPSYICSRCSLLLRDPVQLTDCGHRQCRSCVDDQQGAMIHCSSCLEVTPRDKIMTDRGFKNEMQALLIVCLFCNWTGILKIYQDHLDKSHANPICDYCGEKFTSTNDLNRHKQFDCTKILVLCPLEKFGCEDKIVRIKMSEHYLTEQHQRTLLNIVRQFSSKSVDDQLLSSPMEIKTGSRDLPRTTMAASSAITTSDSVTVQVQELYETLSILSGGVQTLNDDALRLSSESIRHQNQLNICAQELTTLKVSIEEKNAFLNGLGPNQEILQQDLASIKQKVEDMQSVSYNGALTWKIPNVQEKMADAQSERQTSIYSPPFYSSSTGYKMRARLYLHGDGNARRTHISLFFVLMRGEYDAILTFPFNFKVTFCLYDQTAQHHHIIDSFRPDTKSNSFQRPRSEMNIASGIPKFLSLPMIQQDDNLFVRDDTMFIKVMVDFGDMPKALLPYSLGLNPGLPMHVQQSMIQQEADKREQQQTSTSPTTNTETDQSTTVILQQNDACPTALLSNPP